MKGNHDSIEKSENGLNKRDVQFAQTSYYPHIMSYPFKKSALHSLVLCLVDMITVPTVSTLNPSHAVASHLA